MKRILIAAVAILAAQVAFAQTSAKTPDAAKKSLQKAITAVQKAEAKAEAKGKVVPFAVYLTEAKAYLDVYDAPTGGCLALGSRNFIQAVPVCKPNSTVEVVLEGQTFTKDICKYADLYYDVNGNIVFADVTNPLVDNVLDLALEACVKAAAGDEKGKKTKDIAKMITTIADNYYNEGIAKHTLGDVALASVCFEQAAKARATEPNAVVDSISFYNAAICASSAGDEKRALELFRNCLSIGYEAKGEIYSSIGRILYKQDPQSAEAMDILKSGIMKYPESSCLGVLIDQLNSTGGDTDVLFALLDQAISREPGRGVFYYIKGNTYVRLNDFEKAAAEYNKCIEVEPSYDFGYYGLGTAYATQSDAIMEEMNNLPLNDYKTYDKLADKRLEVLKLAVSPFETVYAQTADASMKYVAAQYLKNIYYILQGSDSTYTDSYKKYDEIVKAGKQE